MAFIGNTNTTQAFTPAVDFFSGNASTTAFTLSRPVASVAQVQAVISNVPQDPGSAYTVSGSTITFTSAPPSGTNNIYVSYTSPITQVIAPSQGTVGTTQLQNGLTVNFADGSAAAPSITNDGDTNTGIFFPAADTIAFAEGGAEVMRIDSSGNVGIGTASPAANLHVSSSGNTEVRSATTGANYTTFRLQNSTNDYSMQIRTDVSNAWVLRDETAGANRLVVDTNGKLGINTGGAAYGGTVFRLGVNDSNYCIAVNATAGGTTDMIDFYSSGTFAGKVSSNGATTAYNTSSDYRLKEDITPLTGALTKVSALKPVTFKWKLDGNLGEGFIAHELAEVCPYAVNGEKDEVDSEGNIRAQSIDTSFLVATLTAAIQEQQALITALTARITALENT